MTRNDHYLLLQELDPNDVTDISDAHKKMLLAQGLKPFRTSRNHIKWANTATQIYKLSQQKQKFHLFPRKKKTIARPNRIKRHRRSHLLLAMKDNWILVLMIIMILASLLFVVTFHFNI